MSSRTTENGEVFEDLGEARSLRLHLEYLSVERALQTRRIRHTIAVFGSTRAGEASRFYAMAREFGGLVAAAGGPLVTGGGPGIMEAANRGAFEAGGISIGMNINLPKPQAANRYLTPGLSFHFRYFALRKLHFLLRARALVAFPGGFGTLDEVFETLMLVQTAKIAPLPVVLVGGEFWRRAFDAEFLRAEGMISAVDCGLSDIAESAAQAWQCIVRWYEHRGEELFPATTSFPLP